MLNQELTHPRPVRERRYKYTPLSRIFLSEHYRLREFCQHDLALLYGVKNVPSELGLARGRLLAQRLLEPAHARFGELRILQGFVSAQLNARRIAAGMVANPTSCHIWDRRPEWGLNAAVCSDFCIRGREGDLAGQRELTVFYGESDLPWESVMLFPNTSSVHLVHHPRQAQRYVTMRIEWLVEERPQSQYFKLRDYRNVPWDLLHRSEPENLAAVTAWLKERGDYQPY
jgi:hypothetical protein